MLTWNLCHGRAKPAAGRDLRAEFTAALAGWRWDVALLQEVPPWWPPLLAQACGAEQRTALTSRNTLLAARRLVAERWPDLVGANGGGANAILVRGAAIVEHREVVLRRRPERRVCHAVRLASGVWCVNLHAHVRPAARARADIELAAAAAREWARDAPALLGGDFNVRAPEVPGFAALGGHGVDHVLGRGGFTASSVQTPQRGALSDHRPLLVALQS